MIIRSFRLPEGARPVWGGTRSDEQHRDEPVYPKPTGSMTAVVVAYGDGGDKPLPYGFLVTPTLRSTP